MIHTTIILCPTTAQPDEGRQASFIVDTTECQSWKRPNSVLLGASSFRIIWDTD